MSRRSKLTPEQWAAARVRWEGCEAIGFQWLAEEIEQAWGVKVLRKSLDIMARKVQGWEKGGEPSGPLPPGLRNEVAAKDQGPGSLGGEFKPRRSKPINRAAFMERVKRDRFAIKQPSGVYMLFKGDELVYVGQSLNVLSRIGQHISNGTKDFDGAAYVGCEPELLDSLESALIHLLQPPLNGSGPKQKTPIAPVPMVELFSEA